VRRRTAAALIAIVAIAGPALWRVSVISAGGQESPGHRSRATPVSSVSSPAPALSPASPSPNPAWRPAFAANFSGSRLNTSVWATCYPWMDVSSGCTNFGNNEYEWYLPAQDRVAGGVLQLVAQHVPTQGQTVDGAPKEYSCRSGMATTYPSFRFEYGYVQVVAQIPNGPGLWPALWLAAADQKWPPEIDILEHWSSAARSRVSLHPTGATHNFSYFAKPATANLAVGWHTFGLSWTATKLTWFIDGKAVLSLSKNVPHQLMYLIANLAQASPPQSAGGECSGTMLIRSVEVWRP
jgi:beta-glucanase (GH16 family)